MNRQRARIFDLGHEIINLITSNLEILDIIFSFIFFIAKSCVYLVDNNVCFKKFFTLVFIFPPV